MKQEKLCESEDMTEKDYSQYYPDPTKERQFAEELGAENMRVTIERQLRDAANLMPHPGQLKPSRANSRQVGGEHYKKMDIQPWDVIDFAPKEQKIGFYRYNALKYVMRAGEKGDFKEDIAKAQHYLQKLLEILE